MLIIGSHPGSYHALSPQRPTGFIDPTGPSEFPPFTNDVGTGRVRDLWGEVTNIRLFPHRHLPGVTPTPPLE